MVYGICYYPLSKAEDVKSLGLAGEAVIFSICHLAQYVVILFALLSWDTTCYPWSEGSRSRFLISPLSFTPQTCHFCVLNEKYLFLGHTKEENSWWTPQPLNVDFHIRSNSLTGVSQRSCYITNHAHQY